jgi:hypothetical protein
MSAVAVRKGRGLPVSRVARIRFLLDHWEDIFDPSVTSPGGSPGDGSGVAMLPLMSRHRSVLELARCLVVLAEEAPVQHSHLRAYHGAEWRVRVVRVRKRRPHKRSQGGRPKVEVVETRSRERIVPAWVRMEKVRSGEERLAELFRGSVEIPEDLADAVLLSTDEVEAKRLKRLRARSLRGAAA